MLSAEAHGTEQAVADTLLRGLSGNLAPAACLLELEARVCCLFKQFKGNTGFTIPVAILEAIAALADAQPSLKAEALSSLLLLSLCSTASWNTLLSANAFDIYPELSDLLLQSLAGTSQFFRRTEPELQGEITSALLSLCDVDKWERNGRIQCMLLTPVSVAIKRLRSASMKQEDSDGNAALFHCAISKLPVAAFEPLPSEELAFVLDFLLMRGYDVQFLKRPAQLAHIRGKTVVSAIAEVSHKHPTSAVTDWLSEAAMMHCHSCLDQEEESIAETQVAQEAFSCVSVLLTTGGDRDVLNAANGWLAERRSLHVASAYLAAPSLLYKIVEKNADVRNAVLHLPPCLRSSVDVAIDKALAQLLATVPDVDGLMPTHEEDGQVSFERTLKKTALMHPYLLGRRFDCLAGVCGTILHGLSNRENRYAPASLRALEVVFEVVVMLPAVCLQVGVADEMCGDVLDFIVEEKRLQNGVPEMLSGLTIPMFKTLALLPKEIWKGGFQDIVHTIIKAKGTAKGILEAAETLITVMDET